MEQDFFCATSPRRKCQPSISLLPICGYGDIAAGQLGASAHADYGMITLLSQKDIGGLEVQDAFVVLIDLVSSRSVLGLLVAQR